MAASTIRNKTIKGFGWSALDNVARFGIQFIVGIVLARLLSPDDYGLIGILTIFITVFNAIVDAGFTNALIRKQSVTNEDYNTVFITNLGFSIVLSICLFLCASPIASFFGREELCPMTRVLSSIIVINALSLVQRARLTKNLDFKTQTKVTLFATSISGILGISLACYGLGVWALVYQQITSQLITTILLWKYNKWLPILIFSIASFSEMWSFGWKLLISRLLDSAWQQMYQVVIGKLYSPVSLGLYTRSMQFSDLFSSNLTSIIQRVSFPVLSAIQENQGELKTAYKKLIRTTMLPSFALMLGMAASSKQMILFFIGEKWLECVPYLQLICLYSMLYPLHAINLNMLQVQGRSDVYLKLEIVKKILAIGPLLLGIFVDIFTMLYASVLYGIICYIINAANSGPLIGYKLKHQLLDIYPSLCVSIIMSIPVWIMNYIPITQYLLFPLQCLVGIFILVMLCEIFKLPEYREIKSIVYQLYNK